MSYEILYDRRFIKVKNKYIPLFQCGSNNAYEIINGREVSERFWTIFNYPNKCKYLFTEDEIHQLALTFKDDDCIFKSRNQNFKPEERMHYIYNGIKSAKTVEEYTKYGFPIYIYPSNQIAISDFKKQALKFTKSDELEKFLIKAENNKSQYNISFRIRNMVIPSASTVDLKDSSKYILKHLGSRNNGYIIDITINPDTKTLVSYSYTDRKENAKVYTSEEMQKLLQTLPAYAKKDFRTIKAVPPSLQNTEFYFILSHNSQFFLKLTTKGVYYTFYKRDAKKFASEQLASAYLKKYPILQTQGYTIEKVSK